jgi:hypothetical protein
MNLSDNTNDAKYRKVLEALQPRHLPVTSIKFEPPRKVRKPFSFLTSVVGKVAAVLVVGICVGMFLMHSDSTIAAEKVVQLGLEKLRASKQCDIEFDTRLKAGTPSQPFRLSPDGVMTPARLSYTTTGDNMLSLSWKDDGGSHLIEITQKGSISIDGIAKSTVMPEHARESLSGVLFLGADDFARILDGKQVKMSQNGDTILVRISEKGGEFEAKFSDATGHLLSFKALDKSMGTPIIMFETNSITYK